jgi:dihydroorotate dehydrogenase (NAD+) catalytic subunit
MGANMNCLNTTLGSLNLSNPLIPASGTFFSLNRLPDNFPLQLLGAYLCKTITRECRTGNEQPRIKECPSGMMNSIGLENKGWEYFENTILPLLLKIQNSKWVSIAGSSIEDYAFLAQKLASYPIDAIEINVSCPNVHQGGVQFCQHQASLKEVVRQVRKVSSHFLVTKIAIETSLMKEALNIIAGEGSDAVCIGNTLRGLSIDIATAKPTFKRIFAGYSGPAIKPIALRAVYEARQWMPDYPIIGCGGISNHEDVLEFLMTGANAVEIGTANFLNPMIMIEILEKLKEYCLQSNFPISHYINRAHQEV